MRRIAAICVVGAVLLCVGCGRSVAPGLTVLEGMRDHDLVFRGRVLEVGESPGYWSGILAARQEVIYKIIDIYKGQLPLDTDQVRVAHILVGSGPTEDRNVPQLDPGVIGPGREAVIFAATDFANEKGIFVFGDDPIGVLFIDGRNLTTPSRLHAP
ncbi:hypothetical protein LCGC14_0525320 [marine sediment metagenome]|uniref:Uncharacterized protein n=1 Tax=marine sediment metagenome TaxID=412755 RepID=A0A0F9V5F0_9ZZZZ|nr:hypothetical protein [Phycisphaerae bacterium]HDZ44754.1 hypothetical protein [Phycisphaerae bacterium]